jgi:hypothetical protein
MKEATMGLFDQLIISARETGVFAFYLPFLVTFGVIYGLLIKAKVFGTGRTSNAISAIVAFAAAFYVIGFTPVGIGFATWLGTFFTQSMIVILTFIVGMMVVIISTDIWPTEKGALKMDVVAKYVIVPVILIAIGLLITSGGFSILIPTAAIPGVPGVALSPQDVLIILFALITVGVIWFVTKGEKQ